MNSPITHPETAWLIQIVAPAFGLAALLVVALLLRGRFALALAELQLRHGRHVRQQLAENLRPDPALIWAPEVIAPGRLLLACVAILGVFVVVLSLVTPLFTVLALAAPLAFLMARGLIALAARRYTQQLDRDLTSAVGRLSALLRSGSGFRPALERLMVDMPAGPLRTEWGFLLTRQGTPLDTGGIATPQQVVMALAVQTGSQRHATLLNHLGVAVGQPQDVLARRCEAAYTALQASDRRREEATTELAQVRYSGLVVGLAGLAMAGYLCWSQWERVTLAYGSPLGLLVGPLVLIALLLPIVGGLLLSQVGDVDY